MILLGTITAASTATKDNGNTAVPFTIPAGVKELLIQTDQASVYVGFVSASGGALALAAGLKLAAASEQKTLTFEPVESARILAVHNDALSTANVKVFRVR